MIKLKIEDSLDPEKIGTLHNRLTADAGLIRLTEELRFRPAGNRPSADGLSIIFDEGNLGGFDCETSTYKKKLNWFSDKRVKNRSPSNISVLIRWIFILHPIEFHRDKKKLIDLVKQRLNIDLSPEIEYIESNLKVNDITDLGLADHKPFFNTNNKRKMKKDKHGNIKYI